MQALGAMLDQAFEQWDRTRQGSSGAGGSGDPSEGSSGGQIVPVPQAETLHLEHIGYFDPGF